MPNTGSGDGAGVKPEDPSRAMEIPRQNTVFEAGTPQGANVRWKVTAAFIAAACLVAALIYVAIAIQFETVEHSAQLGAADVAELIADAAIENNNFRPRLQEYVTRLNSLRKRDVVIVDTNKRGLADVNPSEVGLTFDHDSDNEIGKTISDGQTRTFIETSATHPAGAYQIVVPLWKGTSDSSKVTIGAVILEYTAIRDELLAAEREDLYLITAVGIVALLLSTIFGFDFAKRKRRVAYLEQARNDANAANQAKSSFLATMSHEIRTPMNGVIGMVDVLHQTSLNGYQVEMVDLIRESAFSLLTIIDDILDFSKIEAGRMEIDRAPFSVAEVVEKACGILDHVAIKKGVELTLFIDPTIPEPVLGDGQRLCQVLLNLISNAIKFCSGREQAGRVSVRVVLTERHSEQALVEIHVIDNGIGMDEDTQTRVFTAFTQADTSTTRRFGGTGLGLVILRRLVELMGGNVSLQSTPGLGSTFTVRLAFDLPQRTVDAVMPASEVAGLSCLAIGSSDGSIEDIATYLRHGGARVERATDLTQAHALMMLRLKSGPWIWIIDAANTPPPMDDMRAIASSLPEQEIRFVTIGRGARRELRVDYANLIHVDGNVLTRGRLLKAVAIAAGRGTYEEPAPASGKTGAAFKPPSRADALHNRRLILVAEDNETNQKVILRQLALLGFAADVADNGSLTLQRWQSGNYALLLSDLHMPEMDGYELAAAIRAQEQGSCRIPIVALTANTLKGEADRCRALGMDDYLSKPVQLVDLKATLETWLPAVVSSLKSPGEAVPGTAAALAVDVSVLENLIGNDPAVILEFLNDFRISAAQTALALKSACADGQVVKASEQAHKLKSSARAVGALALGELCAEIETAGQAGSTERVVALLPLFQLELDTVNVFLDTLQAQRVGRGNDK